MARWVTVMRVEDLPPDQPVTVRVNERAVALVRCGVGGAPHALDNRCPHGAGQFGDGAIRGEDIICPLHEYGFDLHTGIPRYARTDPACASRRSASTSAAARSGSSS